MRPLKEPTQDEIARYCVFKSEPELVLPIVVEPPGNLGYNFTYPRTDEEGRDVESIKTNYDLVFIKDDLFDNEQIDLLDYHEWQPQQHGSLHYQMMGDIDEWLDKIDSVAKTRTDLPLAEFLIRDTVRAIQEFDPDAEFTYFHGLYYTTQNHIHVGDQIHRDFHRIMAGWTSLYHLTGSTGPTLMFDDYVPDPNKQPGKVIDFKQGRRIIFPGFYAHRAEIPEPGDTRVIAVVRFQIKSKLNDHVFDKTPEIKDKYDLNKINHDNQPK